MSDELLPFYNRELSYIRRSAARFAEAHPKIAARLRLGPEGSEDPHVERLIEAFAYLSARVRFKLDDEFPEINESLLGVLYPHYQAPVPSMAIVQLVLDPDQADLTQGITVEAGRGIETETIQGEPCRFRTCYNTTLWPMEVKAASLVPAPFSAPPGPHTSRTAALLRMVLELRAPGARFAQMEAKSIRFFLKGQALHVYRLYELLFNHVLGVAFATKPDDRGAVFRSADCVRAVGFEPEEGLLPYPPRSFLGYRLLTEFFACPDKFLFFDLELPPQALARCDGRLEVYFYMNRSAAEVEQNVEADTFRLGCTPIVNLYSQRAEPIALTQMQFEYRVVPDVRRQLAHEVYSIDRVTATSPDGESTDYSPLFSVRHSGVERSNASYWHAARRPASADGGERGVVDHGTEVFLSLVDLEFSPRSPANWTLTAETTCLNRDLPARLPFGGDQPELHLTEAAAMIPRILCLTAPTRTFRPALRKGALWKLVSHLALNHLSITGGADGADALREILLLYDFADSSETRSLIDGVLSASHRRVTGRLQGAVCRGVEMTIEFDEDRFSGGNLYLFASVLERFLAMHSSLNSFTRLVATVRGREEALKRWPARVGDKRLL